ncbi:MAG: response regulator [Gammaproteobacteria bacterium]|nr:response regulator [Gammaproteobacteria bacterium]
MIKVLIVDDHQLIRYGFKSLLDNAEDIEVIGEVGTGEAAIEFVRENPPNVILMDLRMPGIGGMEATRKLSRSTPESRILIVTACDAEPFPSMLMQVGASGFLSKTASDDEMLTAVRAIAAGEKYVSPEIQQRIDARLLEGENSSPFNALTDKELQVMLMLISGKKPKYIAEKMYVDPKTICAYRYRIYEKLNIGSDVDLAILAIRYGIIDDVHLQ